MYVLGLCISVTNRLISCASIGFVSSPISGSSISIAEASGVRGAPCLGVRGALLYTGCEGAATPKASPLPRNVATGGKGDVNTPKDNAARPGGGSGDAKSGAGARTGEGALSARELVGGVGTSAITPGV